MPDVVCFGEALIDLLTEPPPRAGEPTRFRQHAGGAPANTAVALARLGGAVSFMGMLAEDPFGDFLWDELTRAGVGTEYIRRRAGGQTALAFVFLDQAGERSFRFYGEQAAHLQFRPEDFPDPFPPSLKLFHVGSNTLTTPESAEVTRYGVAKASASGAWVSMDLNLRPLLWRDERAMRSTVETLLPDVQILKMSRPELAYMAAKADSPERWIQDCLESMVRLVLITDGPHPVTYYTRKRHGTVPAWSVDVRDTTAAGDAFSGALLYRFAEAQGRGDDMEAWVDAPDALESALRFAAAAGALAVSRVGSFAAMPGRDAVEHFLEVRS